MPAAPPDLSFDATTALHPCAEPGSFEADVHPLWAVGDKPNGGYLLALLGRAGRTVAREGSQNSWEVQSAAVTYLRPPDLGPCNVRTTVLRRGRTAAHVRAVLAQHGDDLVDAVFVIGNLPEGVPGRYDGTLPFSAPDPEQCMRLPSRVPGGLHVGINEVLELRLDPSSLPFTDAAPPPGTPAELRGWTRFADGRQPDALSLLFSADAIPPATLMIGSTGWVPTLQLSTYVRAHPAPGWLAVRMTANLVAGGTVDETCVLWDSTGQVVAQSTQLARLRFPDETA
jgi:Acyl-CoA thioesterase C-terminal domain/Acyl-CoA thioesterase N-terminal domain